MATENTSFLANLQDGVNRTFLNRLLRQGANIDPRNLYEQFCYPHRIRFEDYWNQYNRGDIARRICDAYPNASWSTPPTVTDDVDVDTDTEFQTQFELMANATNLFAYLRRTDILANIGQYAVLLVGVRDGKDLREPMGTMSGWEDILYLAPFDEQNAKIQDYDTDPTSERYGLPLTYKVQSGGYTDSEGSVMETKSFLVHHSRVIHVCENNLDNEIFGIPRLQPIWNRIVDLEKVMGGSAELFWLNGRGGLQINATEETQPADVDSLKTQMDEYTGNVRRVLATKATDVNVIEHSVPSPKDQVAVLLDIIAGAVGIPQRILIGSERGELASSQDSDEWIQRVSERQRNFCEPRILTPFVDLCQRQGLLPETEEFEVEWQDLARMSEAERAEIAQKRMAAINSYLNAWRRDADSAEAVC